MTIEWGRVTGGGGVGGGGSPGLSAWLNSQTRIREEGGGHINAI